MSSLRRTLLKPRVLALLGLGLLGVCALMSTSRTGTAILLNLVPLILVMGIPALIAWRVIVYITDRMAARPAENTVEDRLDELERLKRRAMVTPEEYAAKRQDILNDL